MSCEFCKDSVYRDVLGTPCKYNFCPMCGDTLTEQKPLTLNELREMDGEPVWIAPYRCKAEWAIVNVQDNCAVSKDSSVYRLDRCEERAGLRIFRRPPKEAAQ